MEDVAFQLFLLQVARSVWNSPYFLMALCLKEQPILLILPLIVPVPLTPSK